MKESINPQIAGCYNLCRRLHYPILDVARSTDFMKIKCTCRMRDNKHQHSLIRFFFPSSFSLVVPKDSELGACRENCAKTDNSQVNLCEIMHTLSWVRRIGPWLARDRKSDSQHQHLLVAQNRSVTQDCCMEEVRISSERRKISCLSHRDNYHVDHRLLPY